MTTYTIAAKQSNSGSIHNIASEHGDRAIKFGAGCAYAVVCSSYYGGKGYTTQNARSGRTSQQAARRLQPHDHRYRRS